MSSGVLMIHSGASPGQWLSLPPTNALPIGTYLVTMEAGVIPHESILIFQCQPIWRSELTLQGSSLFNTNGKGMSLQNYDLKCQCHLNLEQDLKAEIVSVVESLLLVFSLIVTSVIPYLLSSPSCCP